MNAIFMFDIILNIFSAFYDEDFIIIDSGKVINCFKDLYPLGHRPEVPQDLVLGGHHLRGALRDNLRKRKPEPFREVFSPWENLQGHKGDKACTINQVN